MEARLGLDTAGPYLALALWSPRSGLLARRAPRVERDHAARIVPELEAVLADAGVAKPEVAAVTVGVGPGSYTGLRVGIATAQALCTAWNVPLGGACSLAQLAWGALAPGEAGLAVMDARRGNVYAAAFRRDGDDLVELAPPAKLARPEAAAAWSNVPWIESVAPDATWAAMRRPGERPAEAVYL